MSKIPVDECPAGPEMDAAVAKALGWHWHDGRGTAGPSYWETATGDFAHIDDFEPSTEIAVAWGFASGVLNGRHLTFEGDKWTIWHFEECDLCDDAIAETAALVLSRAFLKANGVEYVEVENESAD